MAFVFQVNCPGCFVYGIPVMNELFMKYENEIGFIGVSTAFEDFELNTEINTQLLLQDNKLTGETKKYYKSISEDVYLQKISFPVAFDSLKPTNEFLTNENVQVICSKNRNFTLLSADEKLMMLNNVKQYYDGLPFIAETFTLNQLSGTPSFIIFDNDYNLLQSFFGHEDKEVIELFLIHYGSLKITK
ncbi:MAG: hypothetical protein J0L56_01980 [Chitinophagales bacterium]|nr:hypothetical protein [Chitinophagales bacterium]